ncbi:hypothetical protein CW702_00665 [Candidatus Bathyarchaeota archaeon]|nr:MAG: hypothetical protein CW702_00665 [Candidatus Bathyarchaeota archaeon]
MRTNMKYTTFGIALLAVVLSILPAFNYLLISSPVESSMTITTQDAATLAIINGDDDWAHFESGKLVIDFDGVTIGERQTIQFGKEDDPVFKIQNNYDKTMAVSFKLTSVSVPDETEVTIYVKDGDGTIHSYTIDSSTGTGTLGTFSLDPAKVANVWIKVQTSGASPGSIQINLSIEAEVD